MAAFHCFFCAKFAKCDNHRADCKAWEAKPAKTVRKRGGKIEVIFK